MRLPSLLSALVLVLSAGGVALAETTLGIAVDFAVRRGDVAAMNSLRGQPVRLEGKTGKVWRETKAYRDVLVVAAEGTELAGLQVLVRLPVHWFEGAVPASVRSNGQIGDFEPYPVDGRLKWHPVVYLSK